MIETINKYNELVKKSIIIYQILNKYYIEHTHTLLSRNDADYLKVHTASFDFYEGTCTISHNSVGITISQTKQIDLSKSYKTIPFEYFELSNAELKVIGLKNKADLEKIVEERIAANTDRDSSLLKAVQGQMVFINTKYQEKHLKKVYRNRVIKLIGEDIVLEQEGGESIKMFKFNKNRSTFVEKHSLFMEMSPKLVRFILGIVRDVTKEMRNRIDY